MSIEHATPHRMALPKSVLVSRLFLGFGLGFAQSLAGSPRHPAESTSSFYGPIIRLGCSPPLLAEAQSRWLQTGERMSEKDFHFLIE